MSFTPQVSNIVYLDSPAGVGFSYSGNKSDYITGDIKTASDSHTFLLKVLTGKNTLTDSTQNSLCGLF